MNKLKISLSAPFAGWMSMKLTLNKIKIIEIDLSAVFDPFPDIVETLKKLKNSRNKKFLIEIDQEGYDAIIEIISLDKILIVTTSTLCDKERQKRTLGWEHKRKFKVNKKDFIRNFKNEIKKNYKKNKKNLEDNVYPFYIDIKELKRH